MATADHQFTKFSPLPIQELKTLQRAGLFLFRRQLKADALFSTQSNFLYYSRKMPTNQGGSATPAVIGFSEQNISSRSLSELARNITSFKWSRPLPTFMATSSRGSVPHLTPDKFHQHSNIPSVHIGLEDFITSPVQDSAILSIETTLQRYLAYPESTTLVLSARRANPVPINASWDERIEINTIDGHKPLLVESFVKAVDQLHLRDKDIVISIPDVTETPGIKRLTKMVQRTQRWLNLLLESNVPTLSSPISDYSLGVKYMRQYHRFLHHEHLHYLMIIWTF